MRSRLTPALRISVLVDLHTVMTKLLENVMYDSPDSDTKKFKINKKVVRDTLKEIVEDEDLSRYIL